MTAEQRIVSAVIPVMLLPAARESRKLELLLRCFLRDLLGRFLRDLLRRLRNRLLGHLLRYFLLGYHDSHLLRARVYNARCLAGRDRHPSAICRRVHSAVELHRRTIATTNSYRQCECTSSMILRQSLHSIFLKFFFATIFSSRMHDTSSCTHDTSRTTRHDEHNMRAS